MIIFFEKKNSEVFFFFNGLYIYTWDQILEISAIFWNHIECISLQIQGEVNVKVTRDNKFGIFLCPGDILVFKICTLTWPVSSYSK